MARLGPLGELDLDHLDAVVAGAFGEFDWVETAVERAAAEVARADLPNEISARLKVIGTKAALAGVVGEASELGTMV